MGGARAYLRLSGKSQVDGDGFPRQCASCERYAAANGLELTAVYMDAAVKGKTELAEREGLSELLEGIDSSTIVLVERADRLARDLMVNELIVEQFRKLNVRVVECEGGSDITVLDNEPTKVLIRQVLAAIAQFEKSCIVAKLKAARDRMRKATGRCEGRKRYKTTDAVRDVILALHGSMPITAIARQLGLSRPTVYQVLRDAHPVS